MRPTSGLSSSRKRDAPLTLCKYISNVRQEKEKITYSAATEGVCATCDEAALVEGAGTLLSAGVEAADALALSLELRLRSGPAGAVLGS